MSSEGNAGGAIELRSLAAAIAAADGEARGSSVWTPQTALGGFG
jgi:hypothetical protein